jgi:hypothetical protein
VAPEITAPVASVTVPLMLPETLLCAAAKLTVNTNPIAVNRAKQHVANLFDIAADCLLRCFSFCQ